MGVYVGYGPKRNRQTREGKLKEIYPIYEQLNANGHQDVEIKDSDNEIIDPHHFYLNVVLGGVTVHSFPPGG